LERIAFRNFVGTVMTEEEAKAAASQVEITDGPDEYGEMYQRPGKLSDRVPKPYANENAARFANNGAYPPDLSLMIKARPRREDYVFSLMMGYKEPPHGVAVRQGLYYNPYFPGGAIAMPKPLNDGMITYDDGTEATPSQMSKDVAVFLAWCAEPEMDIRKKTGFKALTLLFCMAVPTYYYKRLKWSTFKTQVTTFKNHPNPSSLH